MSTVSTMTRKEWLQELLTRARDGRFPALAKGTSRLEPERIGCAYRTPEGNACAAGLLIPNSEYHPSFEGKTAWQLRVEWAVAFPEWATGDLISAAQCAHDDTAAPLIPKPGVPSRSVREPAEWNPEAFLTRLRASEVLRRAFEEEGLVIE